MTEARIPGDLLLHKAVADLVREHQVEREYDSAEVVRSGIEHLVRARGQAVAIHSVLLDDSPPRVKIQIPDDCLDEDAYCRELQRLLGPSVCLVPYFSPLGHTRGRPPAAG